MDDKDLIRKCEKLSNDIRRHIIEMTYCAGNTGAHLGGSLSIVELLVGLYVGTLKYDKDNPNWEKRDRVILSKGHAALALYPTMAEMGIINKEELSSFKMDGGRLGGHPSLNGLPGIEFASGSLGQGLSLGVGTCLALKRKNNNDSRVYVFMGDGECEEGSVWEAAASASHYELDNLVSIIDMNSIQYDGYTTEVMNMNPLDNKWRSFGWDVIVINGHSIIEIINAYKVKTNRPLAIVANTVKGKGVSFMENNWKYHNTNLTKELYEKAINELGVNP